MTSKFRSMKSILLPLSLTLISSLSFADNQKTGLKPMTPQEQALLNKRKLKKIRLNEVGLKRVNEERAKKGLPDLNKEDDLPELEIEASAGTTSTFTDINASATSDFPAQVDNSKLAAFPPIGNQGNLGSCVAFASTYYLASHEICLKLGCNNKNYSQRLLSPKWTYNLINGGQDNGSWFSDAFAVLQKHGAPLNSQFPYDTNFRAWSLNSNHWKGALNNRLSAFNSVASNTDAGIANVKQVLLNGHVMMLGTYVGSWVYKTVKSNPTSTTNPFVGQKIVTHLNGTIAGHAMTIVGYDDSVWADINGNGLVEPAELGAFKIANSYTTSWGNQGFAWASYDAFRSTSAVPNWNPAVRGIITQGTSVFFSTFTPRTPKALAEVTLSHVTRNQIYLQLGASANTQKTPSTLWTPFAFSNIGGAYAFDGTTTAKDGTFYFDLSPVVGSDLNTQMFYLKIKDSVAGNNLAVKSFKVVDPQVGSTIYAASGVPLYFDATTRTFLAGNYDPGDITPPSIVPNFKASLSFYKVKGQVRARANLSWSAATDNVGVTKYYIYRNGVKIGETSSLSYKDSNLNKGITYNYYVTAIDARGNESVKSAIMVLAW